MKTRNTKAFTLFAGLFALLFMLCLTAGALSAIHTGGARLFAHAAAEGVGQTPGLKEYADDYFATDHGFIEIDVTQTTMNRTSNVQSGEPIQWTLNFTFSGSARHGYSGFAGDPSMFDTYKNVEVKMRAPKGIVFTGAGDGAAGYRVETDSEGVSWIIMQLDDVSAIGDASKNITVTGRVAGLDDLLAIGETFTITGEDITCTADIEVLDRNYNNALVGTYGVKANGRFLRDTTLTSTSDDDWSVSKSEPTNRKVSEDGKNYVVFTYTVDVTMNSYASYGQYVKYGRAKFDAFTLTENPWLIHKEGAEGSNRIDPVKTVITPVNFTGESVEGKTISDYAKPSNVNEQVAALADLDRDAPIMSQYKVEVWYEDTLNSEFFDAQHYEAHNEIELSYKLENVNKDLDPVTNGDSNKVDYDDISKPADIALGKNIDSIFGGGNYVTPPSSMDKAFQGTAEFTITPIDVPGTDNASPARVYIYENGQYIAVDSVIQIERGAIKVKRDGAQTYETYAGHFWVSPQIHVI